jgi:hypothetical protein
MRYKILLTLLAAVYTVSLMAQFYTRTGFETETGYVLTGYSDVRIPGDTGDLFSLSRELRAKARPFLRFRLIQPIGERHTVSLLYAPLSIRSSGRLDKVVNFDGTDFSTEANVSALYRFDSYRVTYRYDLVKKPGLEFGLGFTAKIRDAEIKLVQAGTLAKKVNTGFVPIINFRVYKEIDDRFAILLEGDALAAPQGRAEDIQVAGIYNRSEHWKFKLGYRMLEGGADNKEVYNFALLHYIMVGFQINP